MDYFDHQSCDSVAVQKAISLSANRTCSRKCLHVKNIYFLFIHVLKKLEKGLAIQFDKIICSRQLGILFPVGD